MKRSELIAQIAEETAFLKRASTPAHGFGSLPKNLPTRAQIGVMLVLEHHGPQGLADLAKSFCVSPSAANQLIEGLVQDKLVKRSEVAGDRRKIRLELTPTGKKKLLSAKKAHIAAFARLFEPLNDKELRTWQKLQQKVISNLH